MYHLKLFLGCLLVLFVFYFYFYLFDSFNKPEDNVSFCPTKHCAENLEMLPSHIALTVLWSVFVYRFNNHHFEWLILFFHAMVQLILLTTFLTKCLLRLSHSLTFIMCHTFSFSFWKKHSLFYVHFFSQAYNHTKITNVCHWNEWHSFKLSYFSFRIFGKFARKTPLK